MIYRNYKFDTIRCILIVLVVYGHLIETAAIDVSGWWIYRFIYTFHVPALFFLSGMFAKFNPQKIIRRVIIPYFVFQCAYLVFDYIIKPEGGFVLFFTTPYLLLWFIMVLGYYYLLVPFIKTSNRTKAGIIFFVSLVMALLAGYDKTLGYYMSLSRAIVFFPFFIVGIYWAEWSDDNLCFCWFEKHKIINASVLFLLIGLCWYIFYKINIPSQALFGSYSYEATNTNVWIRMLTILCAFSCVLLLLCIFPNRKIPLISSIGQNTLPIYLMHGFATRSLYRFGIFGGTSNQNLIKAAGITVIIVLIIYFPYILFKSLIRSLKEAIY